MLRWPGHVQPGRESQALVNTADVLGTVADILGKELPEDAGLDSYSFLPVLESAEPLEKGLVGLRSSCLLNDPRGNLSLRSGEWKLIHYSGNDPQRKDELYHLKSDPSETIDLADAHPERVEEMSLQIKKILESGSHRNIPLHSVPEK